MLRKFRRVFEQLQCSDTSRAALAQLFHSVPSLVFPCGCFLPLIVAVDYVNCQLLQ